MLVLGDIFILHKYGYKGENEVFLECQDRCRNGCNFKAATLSGDEDGEEESVEVVDSSDNVV